MMSNSNTSPSDAIPFIDFLGVGATTTTWSKLQPNQKLLQYHFFSPLKLLNIGVVQH
jgi:hypothetical protein